MNERLLAEIVAKKRTVRIVELFYFGRRDSTLDPNLGKHDIRSKEQLEQGISIEA